MKLSDVEKRPDVYLFLKTNKKTKFDQLEICDLWIESRASFCTRIAGYLQNKEIKLWIETDIASFLYENTGQWYWEDLDQTNEQHQFFQKKYGYLSTKCLSTKLYSFLNSEFTLKPKYPTVFDAAVASLGDIKIFNRISQLNQFLNTCDDKIFSGKICKLLENIKLPVNQYLVASVTPNHTIPVIKAWWSADDLKNYIECKLNEEIGVVTCMSEILAINFGCNHTNISSLIASPYEFAYDECAELLEEVNGDMFAPLYQEPFFQISSKPIFLNEANRFEFYLNRLRTVERTGVRFFKSEDEFNKYFELSTKKTQTTT